MLILILFLIGLVITIPPFRASAEYRKAIETQNISTLIHAANMFPQDATMLAAAGGALIGLDQFVEARKILNISIEKFPQYYESWYIYSLLPNLTEEEKMRIYEKMSELEPLLNNSYVTQ
jgi:NADH:ubiquinone oxidoreductase subunit 5 (subunit L)/multisubunit Na+/H+ antiporter MnhA subunit